VTVHPTFPGVYVQEVPSGVRTIMGVSTSTALFIGRSARGPMFSPVRCLNYTDFVRTFSDDTSAGALASYVKLFFLNGGTDCYIMRIAHGATQSSVTLLNDAGADVLVLTAKDPGLAGELIRAAVTYNGAQPEITFNLDLFRWAVDSAGNRTKQGAESFKNLSMDPAAPLYAPTVITQNSKLVSAAPTASMPPLTHGFSLSGRVVTVAGAAESDFLAAFEPLLSGKHVQISIGGSPYVDVDLSVLPSMGTGSTATQAIVETKFKNAIEDTFALLTLPPVVVKVTFPAFGSTDSKRLMISSDGLEKDVLVRSAATDDMCIALMMGTANGGIEVGARAGHRPAANGIVFNAANPTALDELAATHQDALTGIKLDVQQPDGLITQDTVTINVIKTNGIDPILTDNINPSPTVHSDGVREKLGLIAAQITAFNATPNISKWRAEVWGSRLAIIPKDDVDDNFVQSSSFDVIPPALKAHFSSNVHYYSLGVAGRKSTDIPPARQKPALTIGSDGTAPLGTDYDAAYLAVDKEVDLFNLMVLPPDSGPTAAAMSTIYPNASVFCQQRRAFLLMDAPPAWSGAQLPTSGADSLTSLRTGLVKDHSAVFYPRLVIDDKGLQKFVGPSGAIAGLCARIDGTRGVFKAPAGTEADLRGILGVEQRFSDGENGILNPRAVNTIRVFPNGIVNWGARTMDGDDDFASEYKYIPIRRLALFMEESLYRGLKWVVFEPNDEPLWAQVRLNVGAFMQGLFRQGAFQGRTPREAYFVKCDNQTTTQNDINLGILNVIVGFAPLKPAEFVVIQIQQMAGQIPT
jgi:phage tail sheath protein FI